MTSRAPEWSHHRLLEFVKSALINIFVTPYSTVCDLYCGSVPDENKWDEAQIAHYIGIDIEDSGVDEIRDAWESQHKTYTTDFFLLDPCIDDVEPHMQNKDNMADIVVCMQHLQLCFETEERVRRLLTNVSSLLKPGGYFFGITPDSSTIWAKYQKNVEAYHNRSGGMKPNMVPNYIRSESYLITFEVEEEKFPFFGKKYQLKFANEFSAETHCLVHFPSMIRLAREAGLEFVELQNLTEFYEDNREQFSSMLADGGHILVDPRGRLLPRSYDVLGLYTTFIFQKPDPDRSAPLMTPLMTPLPEDGIHNPDEREWQSSEWKEEEKKGQVESSLGLGKITEQKGILGPGPADLRFAEAL